MLGKPLLFSDHCWSGNRGVDHIFLRYHLHSRPSARTYYHCGTNQVWWRQFCPVHVLFWLLIGSKLKSILKVSVTNFKWFRTINFQEIISQLNFQCGQNGISSKLHNNLSSRPSFSWYVHISIFIHFYSIIFSSHRFHFRPSSPCKSSQEFRVLSVWEGKLLQ